MRTWNINREVPPYLTLAADYRLSAPQFTNDHIWELKMEGNEPPAMAVQSFLKEFTMKLWWAYLHKYGSIVVKEWYPDNTYLSEARVSPNIQRYLEKPFEAAALEEAQAVAKKLLEELG